jgi:hypothetical protein
MRQVDSEHSEPVISAWVRPLRGFWTEFWLHIGFAALMLIVLVGGWFPEEISARSVGLGAAAGCFVALLLMPGYKVRAGRAGEKLGAIQWWSVVLRTIYLSSRALAIGLCRIPWPGVARLGGSVVSAIAMFQAVQALCLGVLLRRG